jgi:hypothetical protein
VPSPQTSVAAPRPLLLLAQIAGLVATGWFIWSRSILLRLVFQSWSRLIAQALGYAMLACAVSAALTLALYLAIARSRHGAVLAMLLRTSATAVWFAPAVLLLSVFSPLALAAAVVLVVSATRLLYSEWQPLPSDSPPRLVPGISSTGCAAALQAAVTCGLLTRPIAAAVFGCLTVSLFTLSSLNSGRVEVETAQPLPKSIFGLLLTILLAAGLTTIGVGISGAGSSGANSATSRGDSRPSVPSAYVLPPPSGEIGIAETGYPGVILWPEVKPQITLVMPLPSWYRSPVSPAPTVPASIIFSGEYWLFRPPNVRPPQHSYFLKASPLALSFMSLDRVPLRMEAHQKLEHAVDLRCCSAIQIEVSNADRYPGTVMLELVLTDATPRGTQSLVVGTAEVASWPRWNNRGSDGTVSETLNFNVPRTISLPEFNQVGVVFHLDPLRNNRSARISIERFVLVPRS